MKKLLFILLLFMVQSSFAQITKKKNPLDFIPKGYVLFEKITGDLNKDGINDCILIIKGTDKRQFVTHEFRGLLDRNRRGVIILFNKNGYYEQAEKNYDCFRSENEEGGVYFPPDLIVSVKRGNLRFHYAHGRYGYMTFIFKCLNGGFYLIGFEDSNNSGPIVVSQKSINFLTKRIKERKNVNENLLEEDSEVFKTTWKRFSFPKLIRLSKVADMEDLYLLFYDTDIKSL
ncbi:MAG: hypothetical protein ACKO6Q_05645 [Bacteroidota bacterium]